MKTPAGALRPKHIDVTLRNGAFRPLSSAFLASRGWLRGFVTALALIGAWQALVVIFAIEPFLLPTPVAVAAALVDNATAILQAASVTALEIVLGLLCGTLLGVGTALAVAASAGVRRWVMPLLVVSQALPVFAIAPLLVVWLGYGLASKVAMATLIIYFPVASAFLDGLRRTDPGLLDVATLAGGSPGRVLLLIRVPSALPALVSGLKVAAVAAPIGAVVGEWVGASDGLGAMMLHANARSQVDRMFAALAVLVVLAVGLRFLVDRLGARATPWIAESDPAGGEPRPA